MDTTHTFRHAFLSLALAVSAALPLAAHASGQAATAVDAGAALADEAAALKPGDFLWHPERAGPGQLVIVASLPAQQLHVYRNGIRIGVSTISSGKAGKETPTGTFEILQKKQMHHSNLYNNAPMPFMQRLTWDGIALHAGKLPGYPASHGCIRLPAAFAKLLFAETRKGMLVVVADEASHGPEVLYPGTLAPVDTYSGAPLSTRSEAVAGSARSSGVSEPAQVVASLPD